MENYLSKIDYNTIGNRCDITPLFASHSDFNSLVNDIMKLINGVHFDFVACIDALGFILGTAIAQKLKANILAVRKGGKLPVEVDKVNFVDYTKEHKTLEIRKDILLKGSRVLIVDEWIETGAQVLATISLIEKQGSIVSGIATINMDTNANTKSISHGYKVFSVMQNCV